MTTNNNQEILARLREVKEKTPELAEVIDLQHDLLEAQVQARIPPAHLMHSVEEAKTRFSRGISLLRPLEIELDWEAFSNLYRQVCHITSRHRPDLTDQLEEILTLLEDDPDSVQTLVMSYIEDGNLATMNEELKAQGELQTFVFNHALHPFLRAYADALFPLVKQKSWQRGRCPICGGEPDLAFLDVESGSRHLICSRCESQWLYPRIKCPFCNTSDSTKLSYYPFEDGKYRLYVCRDCRRYLKAVDLRKAGHRVLFPVERITTVAMDVAAQEEGFR
jgi:FdhE protein